MDSNPQRWYLVRHAQTVWNRENRIQGHSDSPLSSLGIQQAERLTGYFHARAIQAVICSGLQRTRQTAEAISRSNGHRSALLVEPDFREIHLGTWEGLTPQEVDARYDGAYQRWRLTPSSMSIPGAEPVAAFRERVRRAHAKTLRQREAAQVAIVSHGGVIAALLADALHADYDQLLQRLRLDNAGVTAIEVEAGQPAHVLWINDTTHLDGLAIGTNAFSSSGG